MDKPRITIPKTQPEKLLSPEEIMQKVIISIPALLQEIADELYFIGMCLEKRGIKEGYLTGKERDEDGLQQSD